jgi:dephospho-CoA kinase
LLLMAATNRWLGVQRRIGLTGGIASGKSTVGKLLANHGLPVLDADLFAREALAPGSSASGAVLEHYGESVRARGSKTTTAEVDRAALARIVFNNSEQRQWLEQLLHPLVRKRYASEIEQRQEQPTLVLMIPLLFEAGLEELCSEIWLVDCQPEQQLQRLIQRNRLSITEAQARIAAQWPLASKRPLADLLISNRGKPDELIEQVEAALSKPQRP